MNSKSTWPKNLLFLIMSTIILMETNGMCISRSCTDSLKAAVNKNNFLSRLREQLPYVFMFPVPRLVKSLDRDLVEREKTRWDSVLTSNLEIGQNQSFPSDLLQFSSIESKIAFLETLEAKIGDQGDQIQIFRAMREDFNSELVRRLSLKDEGLLSKDDIQELMDLYYLASNSTGYRIKNLKEVFRPGSELQRAVRIRWQTELAGTEMFRALHEMNLIRTQDTTWERLKFQSRQLGYWVGSLTVNLLSVFTIGVPTFIPRWNKLKVWPNELNADDSYVQYEQNRLALVKGEIRTGWLRKYLPLVVAGAITLNSINSMNQLWQIDHQANQNTIVQMEHLHSRVELEDILKQEMLADLSNSLGRALKDNEIASVDQSVKQMRLQEIGKVLKERQKL